MSQNKTKDPAYVNDFQTPDNVADYMVSLLNKRVQTVLEPTPGLGSIVKALRRAGYNKITAPKDYWTLNKKRKFDAIVGNIPFSSNTFFNCPTEYENSGMAVSYQQLDVLMGMSNNLVMLMPLFVISESDVRLRRLKNYGLVSVTLLPRKTFNYSRIQTCVLQFQKGFKGSTELKVFDLLDFKPKSPLL